MTADADRERYNIDAVLGRHGGAERDGRGHWKKREGTNFVKTYGQGTTYVLARLRRDGRDDLAERV